MDAVATVFPRLKSAGLRGAKAVGNAQMVTVTTERSNEDVVINTSVTTERDTGGNHQESRKQPLSSD
jgi:hypothetical protein